MSEKTHLSSSSLPTETVRGHLSENSESPPNGGALLSEDGTRPCIRSSASDLCPTSGTRPPSEYSIRPREDSTRSAEVDTRSSEDATTRGDLSVCDKTRLIMQSQRVSARESVDSGSSETGIERHVSNDVSRADGGVRFPSGENRNTVRLGLGRAGSGVSVNSQSPVNGECSCTTGVSAPTAGERDCGGTPPAGEHASEEPPAAGGDISSVRPAVPRPRSAEPETGGPDRPPPAPTPLRNGLHLPVQERGSSGPPSSPGDDPGSPLRRSSSLSRQPRFEVRPALTKQQLKYALAEGGDHSVDTRLAPPDGRWAWAVLAASMAINVLIPGFIKSFGVLFDEVCERFDASPAAVSWVPALSFFMYNFMGLVAGAICQKYSCRATATLGGLLASAGLVISCTADHIYYLYIGLGLMGGCGGCFVYCSGILVVGSYFERRRGLANGLCVSGSALGAMVFPPVLDLMLERHGFSDAMLLLAAVLLHVVPCAALYQPVEWHMVRVPAAGAHSPPPLSCGEPERPALGCRSASLGRRASHPLPPPASPCAETLSCSSGSVQSLYYLSTVLHGSALAASQRQGSHQIIEAAIRRRTGSVCSPAERPPPPPSPPPPPPRRPLVELTLLWNPVFLLMITSSALFQVSVSNVLVVLPSYVTHLGYRRQQASLLLSVFAGCDLVGRVGGAALSDLRLLPRRAYLLACYLLSGAALAALPTAAAQYPAAGLAVALAGLATGGVMGLYSVMLIEYLGLERLGSSYGLSVCLSGVTLLAGPPLVGLLRQAAPSPHLVIYVLAALPFLAAAVWLAMPYAQRHVQRREAAVAV